jgi:hypothetical protein
VGLLFVLVSAVGCQQSPPPRVAGGTLDLSAWDFEGQGIVPLDGEWAICWGVLLPPGTNTCPGEGWQTVSVPGIWSEARSGSPIGGKGVATYRLRLVLPPDPAPLAIRAGAPLTASRVWLDGLPEPGTGEVGATPESTSAEPRRNRVYRLDRATEHEVRVQVANFEFRGGGIRRPWTIGPHDAIQARVGRAVLREALLFAVGVLVGVAYLVQFALRPTERARGYFGLAALVLGLRAIPASISDFAQLLVPWASFELLLRLEYLGIALVILAGAGYFLTKVPDVMPPRPIRAIQVFSLALAVVAIGAPLPLVLESLVFYLVVPPLVIGLVILSYGRAWSRGVPGVTGTLVGAVLYLLAVGHDVLRTLESGLGLTIELFPYFIVVWILAEANGLMQRFNRTFARVESLSADLSEANLELQETESAVVRFVPFDFLRLLGKQSIREVGVGDHAWTEMCVLYCGVHGREGPDFDAFNDLVGRWEPAIYHRDGFISHYAGHGLFALFPTASDQAIRAGLEILEIADAFNREHVASGPSQPLFEIGIGITRGMLLVGTVGGPQHLTSGVIGDAVDVAPRLESISRRCPGRMLVSKEAREGITDRGAFVLRAIDPAMLGGDDLVRPIYEVLDVLDSSLHSGPSEPSEREGGARTTETSRA